MITGLGSIVTLFVTIFITVFFVMGFVFILAKIEDWHAFFVLIFTGLYIILTLAGVTFAYSLSAFPFIEPIDVKVYNEKGEFVCKYENVKVAREESNGDGLTIEVNGVTHVLKHYSWEWSDEE